MEIKVNTASWHCRLLDFKERFLFPNRIIGTDRPRTLCSYFWSVIFALPGIAFVWCVYTTAWLFGVDSEYEDGRGELCLKHKPAFWTSLLTFSITLYLVIPYVFLFEGENYEGFMIFGTIIFEAICIIIAALKLKDMYEDRERPERPEREGDSFTTLTWEMVKSAKRKVCPFIEYKEA